MSRPIKQGLDYFPLDVDCDDKIELIEAKHGISGFGIIIKLFQKIYKEGYYINCNEESLLLFSKRINVDINLVNEVINDCLGYNIFNKELHKNYNILTSSGIQKRYFNAIERRKTINCIKNYVIDDNNLINVNINWIETCNSTQSKVKKSKEEKEEEKEIIFDEKEEKTKQLNLHTNGFITPTLFDTFWKMYPRKTDKGKALSKWNQLCAKKENRPTWHEIKNAIRQQQKSDRWQNPTFIPMPTTWLNQSRWLDDPEQMTSFNFEKDELTTCPMGFNFGEDHGSYAGCDKCESSHLKIWSNCKADYLKHTR